MQMPRWGVARRAGGILIGRPFAELGLVMQSVLDVLRRKWATAWRQPMPGHSVIVEFSPPDRAGEALCTRLLVSRRGGRQPAVPG